MAMFCTVPCWINTRRAQTSDAVKHFRGRRELPEANFCREDGARTIRTACPLQAVGGPVSCRIPRQPGSFGKHWLRRKDAPFVPSPHRMGADVR